MPPRSRRARLPSLAVVALWAIAAVVGLAVRDAQAAGAGPPPAELEAVLAREPMIGVACRYTPNVTTCGRVGVAVWLRRPARSVRAVVAGVPVRLHAGGFGGRAATRTYWEAYARVPRDRLRLPTHWYGTKPVRVLRVALTVRHAAGVAAGALHLQLRAGWG